MLTQDRNNVPSNVVMSGINVVIACENSGAQMLATSGSVKNSNSVAQKTI